MRNINQPKESKAAQFANLWIAINMPEMKPRSIIPIVKKAYMAGYRVGKHADKPESK